MTPVRVTRTRRGQVARPVSEAEVQRDVVAYFRSCGWDVWRMQAGTAHGGAMKMAPKDAPDLIALGVGRVVLLECKAPGARLRPSQARMRDRLREAGHDYAVVRGIDDAEAVRAIPHLHGRTE